jgi:hypothetical protein
MPKLPEALYISENAKMDQAATPHIILPGLILLNQQRLWQAAVFPRMVNYIEIPGYIKAKIDTAVAPTACCTANVLGFN